jgi:hypothetical protein
MSGIRIYEWNSRYRDSKRFWDGVPLVKGYVKVYFKNFQIIISLDKSITGDLGNFIEFFYHHPMVHGATNWKK